MPRVPWRWQHTEQVISTYGAELPKVLLSSILATSILGQFGTCGMALCACIFHTGEHHFGEKLKQNYFSISEWCKTA